MEAKKAKKERKTKSSVTMSPMITEINKLPASALAMKYCIGDQEFEVNIKRHVDFSTRSAIMDNIENIYFPSGVYDPYYGDELLDFLIIQVYTDLEFANDFEAFDEFIGNAPDTFSYIMDNIPFEATALRQSVKQVVDKLITEHSIHPAQAMFYADASSLLDSLRGVSNALINVLNSAEKSIGSMGIEDMKELISAMNFAGKADEGRVAKAVLDFQREKEKRTAVKAERDSDVPHI